MSKIQELKENLMKKLENEKNDKLKAEILKRFNLILDAAVLKQAKDLFKIKNCEISATNKNLGEEVEIKESEKIEYEEGDLKSSLEYAEELKRENKNFQNQLNSKQAEIIEFYSQSETVINQLLKYKKKLAEIPTVKETDRIKAETTLENETFKLNAVKQAIKDSHDQEEISLTQIAEVETKINKVLTKSEELTNLINAEKTLVDQIVQFKEQIIPEIANEIEKIKMSISNVEITISEKNEVKTSAIKAFNNLNAKFQNEQGKDKSLHDKLQTILKLKNDIINKKVSSKDIDENASLKKLTLSKEYKKQQENIRKLTADNAQIFQDAQIAKDSKVESEKTLEELKEQTKKDEELSRINNDEIMSLNKDIDGKEAELGSLNDEKLKLTKAIEAQEKEKELIEANIEELTAKYKDLSNQLNSAQKNLDSDPNTLKESQLKVMDMKTLVNNNKNNVNNWLNDLPHNFTKNSTRSDILSQTSTIHFGESNLNVSTIDHVQSKDSSLDIENHVFNIEIDDPETMEANMDYTFSDLNASDIGSDDFMNI